MLFKRHIYIYIYIVGTLSPPLEPTHDILIEELAIVLTLALMLCSSPYLIQADGTLKHHWLRPRPTSHCHRRMAATSKNHVDRPAIFRRKNRKKAWENPWEFPTKRRTESWEAARRAKISAPLWVSLQSKLAATHPFASAQHAQLRLHPQSSQTGVCLHISMHFLCCRD